MTELSQNKGRGWLMVVRVTVEAAAAFFVTASLLNYGATCSAIGRRIAELQLVPASLALALPVLALWLGVTLMFGRIYCSTVCPLGALIDLAGRVRSPRKVFRYKRPLGALRYAMFLLFIVLLLLTPGFARTWLEPFGLYASIVETLTAGRVYIASAVCVAIFGFLAVLAYRRGRLFCNSLCPLAAPLGFMSKRAAFHIDINTDLCIQCRKCVDVCKAECINLDDHVADMSRCVVCFNCLPVCPNDAISYTLSRHALSTPLMQSLKKTSISCNNTSDCCATSSKTASKKPIAQEPEQSASSDDRCATTSPTDSRS